HARLADVDGLALIGPLSAVALSDDRPFANDLARQARSERHPVGARIATAAALAVRVKGAAVLVREQILAPMPNRLDTSRLLDLGSRRNEEDGLPYAIE